MSATPTLNGQVIGQAQYATRAVLDEFLARNDTTFHQWIALNVTGLAGGSIGRDQLVRQMGTALRIEPATAAATCTELVDLGLLSPVHDDLRLTDRGDDRFSLIRDGITGISDRLYGDLPAADLESAGRILATVTERANAALAD
jgi:hypothetical protein